MPQMKPAINLYEEASLEKQAPKSKALNWLATFGKTIIIGVNFVTIGAFVFRVVVDQKRLDLKEKVMTQERVLLANQSFENDFRIMQEKVNLLKEFSTQSVLTERLNLIEQSMPESVVSQSFDLDQKTVVVKAESASGTALSVMAANLLDGGAQDFILKEARFSPEGFAVAFQITF
ncbi:MAG: hypothetical protein ABH814_01100 [bacterium]